MNQIKDFKLSLRPIKLVDYLISQINNSFPDGGKLKADDIMPSVLESLKRLEHCFSYVNNKYFFDGSCCSFNHLNGDQYAMWLYILSNELYKDNAPKNVCEKIFLLNKQLHACDIFYEVNLPSIFLLVHPLGTVLGRGNYSDFFVAYQRCGVGSNKNIYPTLGKYFTMRPGSAILGDSFAGDNCQLASESLIIDTKIPDNSLVFGSPKNQDIRLNVNHHESWRIS